MTNPPRKKIVSIDPRDPAFLNPFDGLRNVTVSKKEMVALQSDLAAAQKRIAELEAALREVIGMWPEYRHGPVKLPPMSVQREVFARANKALTGEPR